MTDYFEEGHELYLREPDLMLIEVWHRALPSWSRTDQEAFLIGYFAMRRQRAAREQEQDYESDSG